MATASNSLLTTTQPTTYQQMFNDLLMIFRNSENFDIGEDRPHAEYQLEIQESFMNKLHRLFIQLAISGLFLFGTSAGAAHLGDACDASIQLRGPLLCVDGRLVNCQKAEGSSERIICEANELSRADAELNRLYQRVLDDLKRERNEYADYAAAQKALTEAQRSWVRFKKFDCEAIGHLNSKGSLQSFDTVACELRHTRNRVADIANLRAP